MLNILSSQKTTSTIAPTRRGFLLGAASLGGALLVGFRSEVQAEALPAYVLPPKPTSPLAAYLRIAPDGSVTILSAQFDMGQAAYHATATLVGEELDFDWSKMTVEGAAGTPELYGNLTQGGAFQLTGGSSGAASSYMRYRQAGAAAREMLLQAASQGWGVPATELKIEKGMIVGGGKSESIGAFVEAAAKLPVPEKVTLKSKSDWKLIGNADLRRYDAKVKVTGKESFTIDVKLDGMLTAVPVHPPMFGATVKSFDATKAKAVKGVVDVVPMSNGLAVVAEHMWAAIKGREALTVTWDDSKAEKRSSATLMEEFRAASAKPATATARKDGDVEAGFAGAAKVLDASFEFPYLAHAALEPLNAVARFNADGTLEVWGGHQAPGFALGTAAAVSGLPPEKIKLHVMKTGGGFGRRATPSSDIIQEVVSIAKAIGNRPVKLQWTREDDTRGGYYRPMYFHALKAGLDKDGKLIAWRQHVVGQSIMKGTPFEGFMVKNGVDPTSVEGASDLPYAIPNQQIDLTTMDVGVPVLWWRAVGSTHTAYAAETFMDEVAEAAGKDPVAFRMEMLKDKPQHAAVLKLAAEKAGWGKPAEGRFQGIALAESFKTFVAQVAEISMKDGQMKVERVVCALDCGVAINPDQVKAQIEGGIGFGLGSILKSKLTLDNGKVVEGNFDGYEVLNLSEMPKVEVHIIASDAYPTGVGEPGVPPVGPAVANAYYQATKKRIRILPFNAPQNS